MDVLIVTKLCVKLINSARQWLVLCFPVETAFGNRIWLCRVGNIQEVKGATIKIFAPSESTFSTILTHPDMRDTYKYFGRHISTENNVSGIVVCQMLHVYKKLDMFSVYLEIILQ